MLTADLSMSSFYPWSCLIFVLSIRHAAAPGVHYSCWVKTGFQQGSLVIPVLGLPILIQSFTMMHPKMIKNWKNIVNLPIFGKGDVF
jgi:hypothetical protein